MDDQASPKSTSEKTRDPRWWEYYAVRYALGVGVGAPLAFLLWLVYSSGAVPAASFTLRSVSTTEAVLWAAAGTAYCYVASVPMLTLHATRSLLSYSRPFIKVLFVSAIAILVFAVCTDVFLLSKPHLLRMVGVSILSVVTCGQLLLLWKVSNGSRELRRFYVNLSANRPKEAEYVESYRHLREHGNSVSIVVFELLLAFVLWSLRPDTGSTSTDKLARLTLILIVWLTPPAMVWLLGSLLVHAPRSAEAPA